MYYLASSLAKSECSAEQFDSKVIQLKRDEKLFLSTVNRPVARHAKGSPPLFSPPFLSCPFLSFPAPPFLPCNPARCTWERCKLLQWVRVKPPTASALLCISSLKIASGGDIFSYFYAKQMMKFCNLGDG